MKKISIFLMMLCLACFGVARADELTVHNGTGTNQYVPFYGYYADESQQNQMIYPATELSAMSGKEITQMVFYYSSLGSYGSGFGTWTISLGETRETTLSGLDNTTTLTEVFTGDLTDLLNTTAKTLTIAFDGSYVYNGGNLLVEFSHVGDGSTYLQCYFYGETVTGAAYCYSSQRSFLPKTTFTYQTPSNCARPTDLAINYREGDATATVTWSGNARSYNVDVNGTIEAVDGTSYTIRDLALATSYTVKVQADCGDEQSAWVNAGSFTTPCPDSYALPYAYGFESESEMSCWTQEDTELTTGYMYSQGNSYAHTGNGCYYFSSYDGTTEPQYLISPELSGVVNGVHVEFWYRKGPNGEESFKVGYSTTDNDPDSFIWDDEVTSLTATYQLYKVNYLAQVKYVAVQYTGADSYYIFLDDFSFTEVNPCLEPTNVAASNVTTTTATISWTAGFEEQEWDLYYTSNSSDVPDDATTPSISGILVPFYNLMSNNSLDPATTYYAYVRSVCGEEETSAWSTPAVFNTECEAMALPYTYDFNDGELSVCWNTITTSPTYTGTQIAGLTETDYAFMFFRGTSDATLALVMPEVDANYPLNGYQITFDAAYYNSSSYTMTSGKLGIGIMTDPTDFSTFTLIEEVTFTENINTNGLGTHTVRLNSYTGSGQYIAIQNIHTQNGYVIVDNIAVTELPACLEPTNLNVDGGKNAVVTWEGNAGSFDIAYANVSTADPAENIVDNTTENTFNLGEAVNLTEGDYYVWVRANCGTDGYSDWTGPVSFHVGYCTPNPTSHDGSGITGVSFGTGDYVVTNGDGSASVPASAPYYGDYTSMIGAVQAGVESTIAITTGTGNWPYVFVIWVDLDYSMSFEDSDIVYIGEASSGNGTLNATITIPATQTVGDYRMRIYGADSYFDNFYNNGTTNWDAAHDPCSSGTYRHAHDYTLRVLEAPSCLPAGDVTVDPETITSTSAVISWTNNNGAEATYTVMQGETVLTTTAVDSYELTGLSAATSYPAGTFTIISDCNETMIANVPAFSTPCDDITTLPWIQDFESYDNNTVPMCWDNSGSGTSTVSGSSSYYVWGVYNYSNNNMIRMNNYWVQNGTALINTPTIVLPAEGAYQLSFDYAHNASCGAFAVKVSTDNGTTFTELASYTQGSGTSYSDPGDFTPVTISLANYAGESIILQFFANANYGNGAIFVDNVAVTEIEIATLTMDIVGHKGGLGNYSLIAFPFNSGENGVDPTTIDGMITEAFDLYYFNEAGDDEGKEWINYDPNQFNLVSGKGYLYASQDSTSITFSGMPIEGAEYEVRLAKTENAEWSGWNLVGNPFADIAYVADGRDFYTMNGAGTNLMLATNRSLQPMEGVFVEAESNNEALTFTTVEPNNGKSVLSLNLSGNNGLLDRAMVRFGESRQLHKIQLNPNGTKLYITVDGQEYAVVRSEEVGEVPVSFKAEESGRYTISMSSENVEFAYLHLIDKKANTDVDLLATTSYSFDACTNDKANRFKLVFATGSTLASDGFAFYSNGGFVITNEGEATLQVVDVNGRVLSSESINGCANVNVDAAAGVYMLRLVNGEGVKVQKVVVR